MTSFRSRPRFKHASKADFETLKNKLTIQLKEPHEHIDGAVYDDHCKIQIATKEQHYWSPHLNVNFEETEDGTILRGRYGPAPNIWTMFAFGYSALGLSVCVVAMYGLTRLSLGLSSTVLWVLPFLLLGIGLLYFSAQAGQKMGVEQTFRIHHFLEEAIEEEIEIG